jgi:hypothetical protein
MLRLLKVAICECLVVLCVVGISATTIAANQGENANVQQIQKNRLANAKNLHDYVVKNYPFPTDGVKGGAVSIRITEVIEAKDRLLKVQLELAGTKAERLKVYIDMLKQSREFDDRVKKYAEVSLQPYVALRYTAWLLDLELAFEREKNAK